MNQNEINAINSVSTERIARNIEENIRYSINAKLQISTLSVTWSNMEERAKLYFKYNIQYEFQDYDFKRQSIYEFSDINILPYMISKLIPRASINIEHMEKMFIDFGTFIILNDGKY